MSPASTASERADQPRASLGYAWYVVIILTALYMLSFVDRTILGLLVGSIKRDLGISDTRIGLLQGLSFALFYTIMGLPLGRLADTRNRRNLIAAGVVIWSIFTGACSIAKSFWSLFFTRIGVGVGEAGLSPAAYSLISDYFPPERLGVAISVYYMGVFLGSALALLVGGMVVDTMARIHTVTLPLLGTIASWRVTFLIVGAPGLLGALVVYTIKEPLRRNMLRNAQGKTAQVSFGQALVQMGKRWQSLGGISLAMVFQSMANYALISWGPTYFLRVHGWTVGQSGRALAVILLVAGCGGMYTGGRLSDHWQRRGLNEAPMRVMVLGAIATVLLLPVGTLLSDTRWTLAFLFAGVFALALPMGISAAALQRIFPNQVRGVVSALYLFVLNIGGLSLGPLLPGVFNDYLFHNGKMIGYSLSITMGGAAVLMLITLLAAYRHYRGHYQMMVETTAAA
ncbi:MAG TPA: MFS transporter [Bryobacteraceae bacterium]|jgi:MFS family permease|nr:MFS transporter [Bryobacteraceae bacterium]